MPPTESPPDAARQEALRRIRQSVVERLRLVRHRQLPMPTIQKQAATGLGRRLVAAIGGHAAIPELVAEAVEQLLANGTVELHETPKHFMLRLPLRPEGR